MAAAARTGLQAARMVQAAANPYVMVKHGRREDRAAVYDRFILACTRCAQARDGSGVEEVWAAWMAINLRARPIVRDAARSLAVDTLSIAVPEHSRDVLASVLAASPFEMQEGVISGGLHRFVAVAREDLGRRWWKAPVCGWRDLRRWQARRKTAQALQEEMHVIDSFLERFLASSEETSHDCPTCEVR